MALMNWEDIDDDADKIIKFISNEKSFTDAKPPQEGKKKHADGCKQ
jgi:hypothetical protein